MSIEVVNFGCRLNAAEGDGVRAAAASAGLAGAIIINSCAVTGEAVAQARQTIRRLRRTRPDARILVTGCAAETDAAQFAAMAEVDALVGNAGKLDAAVWRAARDGRPAPGDIMAAQRFASPAPGAIAHDLPRAYVPVQNGCDHRCTFCIIPFGRGRSRSASPDDVAAQIRPLLAHGVPEIVLTGVDLTSYGADLPEGLALGGLVKRLLRELPELTRLRLSSIDAAELDDDLFDVIASDDRLMPHLHLSLQAGDDLILRRMKRRHRRADAVALCARLRALRPDIALGADLIAGFPTEDEAMAARTRDLVADCGLTFLHVFPFSPRPGTPAARMPQVPREVVRERARLLREAGDAALATRLASEVGKTRSVLAESASAGRTEHYLPVALNAAQPGAVRMMRIAATDGARLIAASDEFLHRRDQPGDVLRP